MILAEGVSRLGDRWTLQVDDPDANERVISVDVLTPTGDRTRGGFAGESPLPPGANLAVYWGLSDHGPYRSILRVGPEVHRVKVLMSDDTTEEIDLHLTEIPGVQFGVLICPRTMRARSFELSDSHGGRIEVRR